MAAIAATSTSSIDLSALMSSLQQLSGTLSTLVAQLQAQAQASATAAEAGATTLAGGPTTSGCGCGAPAGAVAGAAQVAPGGGDAAAAYAAPTTASMLGAAGAPEAAPVAAAAPSSPAKKTKGEEFVDEVRKHLGVKYKWGGASPSGFDCSGLMLFAAKQLGIDIPRTAAAQFKQGAKVEKADLQPGDLVFFENTGGRKGITHVGIYAGNGEFIHAPKTGDVVKVSKLEGRPNYAGARRFT